MRSIIVYLMVKHILIQLSLSLRILFNIIRRKYETKQDNTSVFDACRGSAS